MALASSPNSLLGCPHPPSLIAQSSQRQAWQRKGGVLVSASAAGDEPSPTAGNMVVGDDHVYIKFKLGNSEVIPAFEEAVSTMQVGGIRSHGAGYGIGTFAQLESRSLFSTGPSSLATGKRRGRTLSSAISRIEGSSRAAASWCVQPKGPRARRCIVAASSNEEDETEEASKASSSVTEVAKPAISEKRAEAEAQVKKGQRTAIVTGVISVLLGVGYLVLIQLLDTRGVILVPPPPEAFDP